MPSKKNVKTDMMFCLKQYATYRSVLVISLFGARQYGTILYTMRHDFVCCSCNHISHTKKRIDHGDKPAASQIHNISANIAPFFDPVQAP
jgi:hypothetical protein